MFPPPEVRRSGDMTMPEFYELYFNSVPDEFKPKACQCFEISTLDSNFYEKGICYCEECEKIKRIWYAIEYCVSCDYLMLLKSVPQKHPMCDPCANEE